jgi:hypothetical protein
MPAVIEYAEEHRWDIDFYMACVYNISRIDRVSSSITGKANAEEPFFEGDIPIMYKAIRSVDKPCLVFKILGAARPRKRLKDSLGRGVILCAIPIKPKSLGWVVSMVKDLPFEPVSKPG